jgi:succinyl-CoA synthetase beta subunit
MKLLEHEAKKVLKEAGIAIPAGFLINVPEELPAHLPALSDRIMLKAQVDVGGRGKAGGILMADPATAVATARELFSRKIKGLPVRQVLAEEHLIIRHEYYLSITVDRSSRQPLVLFADAGGVDIETTAREHPEAIRKDVVNPLLRDIPPFMLRDLLGTAPKEIGPAINRLYHAFCDRDAILAEINPLVTTPQGVYAADAKFIVDDNALGRQGITVNRDLSEREREAEKHGFSYVELGGNIGVIGNGAGLTMATLDLIEFYGGRAANFLDVGGGAESERVMYAVRLVAGVPSVKVIVVNLLGGITKCDEVAKGIISAGISQKVIVRLAGTNEAEGRLLLVEKGYEMLDTMDLVVKKAVGVAAS